MVLFFKVVEYMVMGSCALSLTLAAMFLLGIFRNLPGILSMLRKALQWMLSVSCVLYRPILTWMNSGCEKQTGYSLVTPLPRTIITTAFSLVIGLTISLMLGWRITMVRILLFALHGLLVGIAWEIPSQEKGLQLGERVD